MNAACPKQNRPARRIQMPDRQKRAVLIALCVLPALFLIGLLGACGPEQGAGGGTSAQDGHLDLDDWDFDSLGPVSLNGTWKFIWMEDRAQFARPDYDDSIWDTIGAQEGFSEKTGDRFGFCWMRLRISIPSDPFAHRDLAIAIPPIHSSAEIYVNGELIVQNGRVGPDNSRTIPNLMPHLEPLHLHPSEDEIVIAIRGANFHRLVGGMVTPPKLGRIADLQSGQYRWELWNTMVVGAYIILILYHILFWIGRREDPSSILFAGICAIILTRMAALNLYFEQLFPLLDVFAFRFKLEYMGPAACIYVIPAFYASLYPAEFWERPLKAAKWVAAALFVYPVVMPLKYFSLLVPLYQNLLALGILTFGTYVLYGLIVATKRKREGTRIVLFGFVILFAGAISDVLYDEGIIRLKNMVQHGGLAFILFNAVVLALRSAKVYRTSEYLSTNLKQEVGVKTEELKRKNVQMLELDKQKTLLFQNISHEFRTPLTLILGPLHSSLDNGQDQYTPITAAQTQIMLRNAKRLLRLINQLLDLSKLEAGKMKVKARKTNLVRLLRQVSCSFESLAARHQVQFDCVSSSETVEVYFDQEKIEKVFYNLLSNAFKVTGPGGKIRVAITTTDTEARVRVTDTGRGIPADQLPFIFERFRQVDGSSTREFEGTGIGLSIVKEYVDLHRGTIEVESEMNLGTSFVIAIPLGKEHFSSDEITGHKILDMIEAGEEFDEEDAIRDPAVTPEEWIIRDEPETMTPVLSEDAETILIVEDNQDMRSYIRQVLQPFFYLEEAADGEEGLRKARELKPDLILSDVMMPKMDGYEMIRALAADPRTVDIPIIVLTAKASEDMKIEGLREGAHDFLSKPFNPKELLARISNLIRLLRKEKEVDRLNRHMREQLLKRYLPPPLIEQILAGETSIEEKPKSQPCTILFSDLEKFTQASSDLRAQEMSRLLNEYLDAMIEIIFRYGGTIDKFIGDSIMVIFGAPVFLNPSLQATRAAACAVAMQNEIRRLEADWQKAGVTSLRMRIGIHHGPVVVGHFGNERRMDFTAIGPAVNLASRIESACEPGQVFVSGEVCDYLPRKSFEKVGSFAMKNVREEVTLYKLMHDTIWEEYAVNPDPTG
jgi:signal transduction histidine kinase/class 3 adenylate cyclase